MLQRQNQNVSLAHRPSAQSGRVGGNFQVELAVDAREAVNFQPYAQWIKHRLDHRSLEEPTTLEQIARSAAEEIFQTPVPSGHWHSLSVTETDQRCITVFADHTVQTRLRLRNLLLVVDGVADTSQIQARVDEVFCADLSSENEFMWGQLLWSHLRELIPGLLEVLVDLGCHRSLRLADDSPSLR